MGTGVTGDAGEYLVDQKLRELGWSRETALGGSQRGADGVWEKDGARVAVAIRTRIDARQFDDLKEKPAESLRRVADKFGATPLFVAAEISQPTIDFGAGKCEPGELLEARACHVDRMKKIAADARAAYAREPYLRGPNRGQMKPGTGCRFAIDLDDLEPLEGILNQVPTHAAPSA